MNTTVLIMDIKDSKKYKPEKRQLLQELILTACEYLNGLFTEGIVKNVSFSAGDEIQGMFNSSAAAFLFYRHMCLFTGSGVFRGGIGTGKWDIRINNESSSSQDGEAYHLARKAIDFSHKNKKYNLIFLENQSRDTECAILADHCISIFELRTNSQNSIALALELFSPLSAFPIKQTSAASKAFALHEKFINKKSSILDARESMELFEERAKFNLEYALNVIQNNYEPINSFLPNTSHWFSRTASPIFKKSRQNIEELLNKGRVEQERNAARLACLYYSQDINL